MLYHICRLFQVCLFSVCLELVILLKFSNLLLAANQVNQSYGFKQGFTHAALLDFFFKENFFLKINQETFLTIYESIIVFVVTVLLIFALWLLQKPKTITPSGPGFKLLNINEKDLFISIKPEIQSLELLSKINTCKKYRLSANLNRVTLTPHKNSFLIDDRNYKNALLINRRRSHRILLANNDILDVGEMVLLYRNPDLSFDHINSNLEGKIELNAASSRIKGPVQKGTPILTFLGNQQKIPLIRNTNTMGKSNSNDVVIESDEVASRHAKIYKVGNTWKIQNLHIHETTSVNGRRIDQRFLQDGDEVTLGDVLIRFNISNTKFRQKARKKIEPAKETKTT
tara:strand:+ start:55 stop:1080 length:1026 start_codon:yes stop_codon:yes gene_type:complete